MRTNFTLNAVVQGKRQQRGRGGGRGHEDMKNTYEATLNIIENDRYQNYLRKHRHYIENILFYLLNKMNEDPKKKDFKKDIFIFSFFSFLHCIMSRFKISNFFVF